MTFSKNNILSFIRTLKISNSFVSMVSTSSRNDNAKNILHAEALLQVSHFRPAELQATTELFLTQLRSFIYKDFMTKDVE